MLSVLINIVLHITGGLAATLTAKLVVALKVAATIDVLSTLSFARTIAACGL
jgi:hypothetical protein